MSITLSDEQHARKALHHEVVKLRDIIWALRRGACWCEMAVGNPMVKEHSSACRAAKNQFEAN